MVPEQCWRSNSTEHWAVLLLFNPLKRKEKISGTSKQSVIGIDRKAKREYYKSSIEDKEVKLICGFFPSVGVQVLYGNSACTIPLLTTRTAQVFQPSGCQNRVCDATSF